MKKFKTEEGIIFENEKVKVFFANNKSYKVLNDLRKAVVFSHQVHGTRIINEASKNQVNNSLSFLEEADGIKIERKGTAVGIQTADCVPCFLVSDNTIFSLHLGWRSLVHGLLDKALQDFTKTEALSLFIGPHIQQSSFECGLEVLQVFKEKHRNNSSYFKIHGNKAFINLTTVIEQKCADFNIQIFKTEVDTLTSKDFFSYRRSVKSNKQTHNRNISLAFFK